MLPILGNDVDVLTLVSAQDSAVTLEQQLREAQDRVERRAQLVTHVGQELGLVLVGALQLDVERGEPCGLFGGEVKQVRFLDRGGRVLGEQGQQLDRVAVELTSVIDGKHAQQLVTHDQRKARKGLDAFLGHPGVEANMAMVGRVIGHDRHPEFGHLADLAHPALDPSGNGGRVGGGVVAGTPPERAIARLQQPDLRRREPEVAGERAGYDIEQLGLEQFLVHLVDRLVEQLEPPRTLLALVEETDIAKRHRQLLREDLERLLLPPRQAPLIVAGLEVQYAKDLAFQQHRRTEGTRVAGRIEGGQVKEWRLAQHDEALRAHHAANNAIGHRDGIAFDRPREADRGAQGEHAAIFIEEDDGA